MSPYRTIDDTNKAKATSTQAETQSRRSNIHTGPKATPQKRVDGHVALATTADTQHGGDDLNARRIQSRRSDIHTSPIAAHPLAEDEGSSPPTTN